jgi:hypothetical protein
LKRFLLIVFVALAGVLPVQAEEKYPSALEELLPLEVSLSQYTTRIEMEYVGCRLTFEIYKVERHKTRLQKRQYVNLEDYDTSNGKITLFGNSNETFFPSWPPKWMSNEQLALKLLADYQRFSEVEAAYKEKFQNLEPRSAKQDTVKKALLMDLQKGKFGRFIQDNYSIVRKFGNTYAVVPTTSDLYLSFEMDTPLSERLLGAFDKHKEQNCLEM